MRFVPRAKTYTGRLLKINLETGEVNLYKGPVGAIPYKTWDKVEKVEFSEVTLGTYDHEDRELSLTTVSPLKVLIVEESGKKLIVREIEAKIPFI